MTLIAVSPSLYEYDYALWTDDIAAKLRAKDFENLDLDNLIEEIEALGRSERHELKSRLDVLLSHILKRLYVNLPHDYNGWERTIREQRKQIKRRLADSPSLNSYLGQIFDEVWLDALTEVQEDYPQVQFPKIWQFSRNIEVLLNQKFWE